MNTEELKMVLDALSKISGDAGNAAQWWMVAHYGTQILRDLFMLLGVVGGLWVVSKIIAGAISGGNEWAVLGKQWARRLGGGTSYFPADMDHVRFNTVLADAEKLRAQK